jgi:ATP-dependent helicase/nuclease subunit B
MLRIFSTNREIREFTSKLDNQVIDNITSIGEFLKKIVVVPNKTFIDSENRIIYLFKAIENLDISKLGFKKEFLSFAKNSEFIFKFFEELFVERVDISSLKEFDTYQDYEIHLEILEHIFFNYKELLEKNGLVDKIIIEDYRLNENYLKSVGDIEFKIDGYLSKFEIEVLEKIPNRIILTLNATKFNKKLIDRLGFELENGFEYRLDFHKKEILDKTPLNKINKKIDIDSFSQNYFQLNYAFQKIDEFIKDGANPEKIALILPDELQAKFLRVLDTHKNLNFAMGIPFVEGDYYQTLNNIYKVVSEDDEIAKKLVKVEILEKFNQLKNFDEFCQFIESLDATNEEKRVIEEEIFKFKKFKSHLENENKLTLLYQYLKTLKQLKFDDVRSGKITVQGVLEARGLEFDGVVILDFNEGIVPSVSDKDLFLNSTIRKLSNMPTRNDKENLQKNYYFSIINSSKRVALSYIQNEEKSASRFLNELNLTPKEKVSDKIYSEIVFKYSNEKEHFEEDIYDELKLTKLTPTRLKDYLNCKRKYYYKYLKEIKNDELEESEELLGSIIHNALERAIKNKNNFNNYEDYFSFVMNEIYSNQTLKIERFNIAVLWTDKIKSFCEMDFERLQNYNQTKLEEWLNVKYMDFSISAKVDRIDENEKEIVLIDYKTSRSLDKTIKDKSDFQLLFYFLWAKNENKNKIIKTAYYDIYNSEFKEIESYEREKEFQMILESIKNANEINFEKCEDVQNCKYCEYKIACGRD